MATAEPLAEVGPTVSRDPLIGAQLGEYKALSLLGQGATGVTTLVTGAAGIALLIAGAAAVTTAIVWLKPGDEAPAE